MSERELDNAYNKYAVAVNNEQGKIVGYVPINYQRYLPDLFIIMEK